MRPVPLHSNGGLPIVVDQARNALRLLVPSAGATSANDEITPTSHRATLDVGEGGRLLGLEIELASPGEPDSEEPWYLDLEDAPGDQLRSVPVVVNIGRADSGEVRWVDLPRRGEGYELTFPSGNQCWVRPRRRMS